MTAKNYNQKELRAYYEGFDVYENFLNGAPKESNPYKRGTVRYIAWLDGYEECAKLEREAHIRRTNASQEFVI